MFQMKEKHKNPHEELNEVKISKVLNKEFKVVIIKMIREFWRRMDEHSEKLEVSNKELGIKKNQMELKNTIAEIENTLEGINS